ncbi:hypothetical protein HT574_13250 [Parageobacillus sp. VR-IP]|uniref:hypothetical protein n=1 Tax=Parageobacillus sp. VR-IP TaxID=2742205 RepID=UPI0015836CC7|nr:hypothetical protein [Parageobacillus sp. VR-IP]NUK31016.1 hypothetical protein [Parageobacillus sp. VR-IP]
MLAGWGHTRRLALPSTSISLPNLPCSANDDTMNLNFGLVLTMAVSDQLTAFSFSTNC